jgi:hypothetical protein
MSRARARYLKAKLDYAFAVEAEKTARLSSDGMSPELGVAARGVQFAGEELIRAKDNFYAGFRADLSAHDPEFRRLEKNAYAAQAALQQGKLMAAELRRVLTTSLVAPEGLDTLDDATRDSYGRLNAATRKLGRGGLTAIDSELHVLEERAEEYQGRAYCYLEAAIEREEARAA